MAAMSVRTVMLGLAAACLLWPVAPRADEDLSVKREACHATARLRFRGPPKGGSTEYRRVVERRQAYILTCMSERSAEQPAPGPRRPGRTSR